MAAAFLASRLLFLAVATLVLCACSALASRRRFASAAAAVPSAAQPNATEQFLSVHNAARAAVGVPPLKWSPKLASGASLTVRYQRDKKGCEFADLGGSAYGANQAWSSYAAAPAEAVASWVDEKKYYDHAGNTCAPGHECGTYTQVVWRRSVELGCARATCGARGAGPALTLCFYNPHGNVQGESPY